VHDEALDTWLSLDLTIGQLKSLFFINFEGVTNLKNLSAALGTTPPNVSGIIDRPVEHDLVSRECNQFNRREQRLELTSRGKRLITELEERTISKHSSLLERLEIEDLSALFQGLTAMARAARQEEVATKKTKRKVLSSGLQAV
jgi:DNA-binding MarR family transcriptional regulator